MTDDRLLQELLQSPLEDRPPRDPGRIRAWFGAVVAVLAVFGLGYLFFGGGDGPPGVVDTTTSLSADSTVAGGSVATTTTVAEVVYPEANGRMHEIVTLGDGELLMFGGFIRLDNGQAPFEGTWRFDVLEGEWSVEYPEIAPSPRLGHAMAFHPPTGDVYVFGGGPAPFRACPRIRFCPGAEDNQLWRYEPASGVWEDLTPAVPEDEVWPIPRFGARFAYEPVTERLIMFGGVGVFGEALTPNFWNDTWAYDPASNTWEDMSAPDDANRPQGSVAYGFVWDDGAQRILMFGGDGIPDDPQTLYAFDPATAQWEDLGVNDPGLGPKDRVFHSFVSDPQTGRAVMIGGFGSIYRIISGGTIRNNGNLDEVWSWSVAEGWIAHNPLDGDVVAAGAVGDPATQGIIVYGGNSVWSYDLAVDTWTVVWERPEESGT